MVAAGSSVAKLNLRRGNCSAHNVMSGDNNSDGDLSIVNNSECYSSMVDVDRDPSCVSFTTFNILAPIYKRIDPKVLPCALILNVFNIYAIPVVWRIISQIVLF